MTDPAFASIADLETRTGERFDGDAAARAQAALEDASACIRTAANKTWLDDDGELLGVPDVLIGLCCTVASRGLGNPDGVTQFAVGDYSESRTPSDIYLTRPERRMARKAANGSGLRSVPVQGPYDVPTSSSSSGYSLGSPELDMPTFE